MSEHIYNKLDAWLDGELGEAERKRFETHIAACAECRETVEQAHWMLAKAAALPREISPPRDLWTGIESRLAERKTTRRWQWPQALAAGLVAAIVFMGGMGVDRLLKQADTATLQMAAGASKARQTLPDAYVRLVSNAGYSDTTEADMLRNLLEINLAIREVETAIEQNPDDPMLRRMLASLYEQEIGILNRAEIMNATHRSNTTKTRTGI